MSGETKTVCNCCSNGQNGHEVNCHTDKHSHSHCENGMHKTEGGSQANAPSCGCHGENCTCHSHGDNVCDDDDDDCHGDSCNCHEDSCNCHNETCAGHSHDEGCGCGEPDNGHVRFVLLGIGTAVFAGALFVPEGWLRLLAFIAAYVLLGYDVLLNAARNIGKGQIFDENFLMSVSTIGAFYIGEFPEAVAVMLFYQIGERLQDAAAGRSRRSIRNLMNIKADTANLVTENGISVVPPAGVAVGQIVLVKPGERFPLDGVITEGETQADTSPLTGESVPRMLTVGSKALSGTVNLTGAVKLRVTSDYKNSTVAKIMEMVEQASARKAPAERFIRRFARVYTPIVVAAAVVLAVVPPLLTALLPGTDLAAMLYGGGTYSLWAEWIRRALVFLVVSCPCALVVSVPLTFFSGIGASSQKGVLVKGGNYIQALAEIDTVVLDKTGTLTRGVFTVTALHAANGQSQADLLEAAALAEWDSNHPVAQAICAYAKEKGLSGATHESYTEYAGLGVEARINGVAYLCGNARLMAAHGLTAAEYAGHGSVAHVARGGQYLGYIVVSDVLRPDAEKLVPALEAVNIQRVVMLTGDRKESAEALAKPLGIKEIRAELLPDGKVHAIESLYSERKQCKIAFVGDGINDAPVLSRADVGIAMGGIGSDAAIEAADVVLMTDEPLKVAEAIRTARNTMCIVKQNVVFSLAVKFIVLGLAVFGLANMWLAVFADVGVTLLAVLNAMRRK